MNPQAQLCPNPDCGARGKDGKIGIHSQKEQRYRCKQCGHTFTETRQTALYRVKKPHALFVVVITLLAYGCPVQAIVAAYQLDERTVWAWLRRAGRHCQTFHEGQLSAHQLELGQIQADELKVKTYVDTLWMGLVMMVSTRLWLGGAVNKSRGKKLLTAVLECARQAGRGGDLLIAVDGFNIYLEVIPLIFTRSWNWLQACWQGWTQVAVVQTMKQKGGKRGKIDRQIAWGETGFVRWMIRASQGHGWINSAYIERLNATFRARIACLVREGRSLIRQEQHLTCWMWLVGSVYNWCTYHEALALALPVSQRKRFWIKRTPAIAAQLTDHCWSVAELMWCKHPSSSLLAKRILGAATSPRYYA
jgi:transposase-like protein